MCLKCHGGLSDETVIEQLSESLTNPQYEKWNETSISHLCIAYMGMNGQKGVEVAEKLLANYVDWKSKNISLSDGSFFGNPTVDQVMKMINGSNKVKSYFRDNNITETSAIKHAFYSDKEQNKILMQLLESEQ